MTRWNCYLRVAHWKALKRTNTQQLELLNSWSSMGVRPKLRRNDTFGSNPEVDFDEFDMFQSPERRPTPYRTPYRSPSRRRHRRTYREYRQTERFEESPEEHIPEQIPLDTAKVMKALNHIRYELDYLLALNVISEKQISFIIGELPESIPVGYAPVSDLILNSSLKLCWMRRETNMK